MFVKVFLVALTLVGCIGCYDPPDMNVLITTGEGSNTQNETTNNTTDLFPPEEQQ